MYQIDVPLDWYNHFTNTAAQGKEIAVSMKDGKLVVEPKRHSFAYFLR